MFDFLRNLFMGDSYKVNSEAVIISCFYNPQNNPYRLLAFQKWYHSIKHMDHRIIECLIGDARRQLPQSEYITTVQTESLLWHKESLLNNLVKELPEEYKYIFWVDADVLFTNPDWLVRAVERLQTVNILQPFEYCIHLQRNKLKPDFDVEFQRGPVNNPTTRHKDMWKSFCANHVIGGSGVSGDHNYDRHGHVGFAWGARREVLEQCPLYDKALIGGSDHILAHAAVGQVPHNCIAKSFTENLDEVLEWSRQFYKATGGLVGYVEGDLYHIWHGDIANRQYLQRIRDFTGETKTLSQRDKNGLYVKPGKNAYMKRYYRQREVSEIYYDDFYDFDAGFYEDMGYMIGDIIRLFGQPSYYDDIDDGQPVQQQVAPQEIVGTPPPADATYSQPEVSQHVPVPQEVYSNELGTGNIQATSSSNFS